MAPKLLSEQVLSFIYDKQKQDSALLSIHQDIYQSMVKRVRKQIFMGVYEHRAGEIISSWPIIEARAVFNSLLLMKLEKFVDRALCGSPANLRAAGKK